MQPQLIDSNGFALLFGFEQVDRAVLVFEALEFEREAQAVARRAAVVAVEFHRFTSS